MRVPRRLAALAAGGATGLLMLTPPAASASSTTLPALTLGRQYSKVLAKNVVLYQQAVRGTVSRDRSNCYVLWSVIGSGSHLRTPGVHVSGRWRLVGTANTAGMFGVINGDYFSYSNGAPIHPWIQNGHVMMATADPMGVVGVGTDGQIHDADVWITGRALLGTRSVGLWGVNTPFAPTRPTLYTNRWGIYDRPALGSRATEIVLRHNVAVAVHAHVTTTRVPSDGAILVGPTSLLGWPRVGQFIPVTMALHTNAPAPYVNAIGHGVRILVNGAVGNLSQTDPHPRPRTAVAWKGQHTLMLVTCNGDDSVPGNLGLGDNELTSYLHYLRVTGAVLLDGGGSTTMAVTLPGHSSMSLVVSASYDYNRPTADAIGITVP